MAEEAFFRELFDEFLLESSRRLETIEQILLGIGERPSLNTPAAIEQIRRELHTIKGTAGMMGVGEMQRCAHQLEDEISGHQTLSAEQVSSLLAGVDQFRALQQIAAQQNSGGQETAESIADSGSALVVPVAAVEALVELLADSVILGSRLSRQIEALGEAGEPIALAWEALEKTLTSIHRRALALRLVPLNPLFASLHRVVHDESQREGKDVRFTATGGDTPLDKSLLDVASEALGHIVRNAVIHGVERKDVRRARGKIATASIRVSATSSGAEEICVTVEDDGGGIDRTRLLEAAATRGLSVEDPNDLESLLYLPGLSTREQTTLSAGRGIGLSASVTAVRRLGGRIEVSTTLGEGTAFRLFLPMQVSMLRMMLVEADGEQYAVPLSSVATVARMGAHDLHVINGAGAVGRRRGFLPLLDLGVTFGTAREIRTEGTVVTLLVGGKRRGLLVDQPGAVLDCVVKPLDPICGSAAGLLGTTIVSDGRVLLALDPVGLLDRPLAVKGAA
jgi:two-component system chemotaxis sensor kinase CheA